MKPLQVFTRVRYNETKITSELYWEGTSCEAQRNTGSLRG